MSDPRTVLERAAQRIDPRSDAFEHLERRRARKARNRRIGAGVLALVLTVGGSLAALSAFRGTDDEQTIGGVEADTGFHALWPETMLAEAEAAQEAVEASDPDLGFRLSADATAATFARDVLLLEQFTIDGMNDIELSVDHRTGPVVVEIAPPPPPCPSPTQLADICGPSTFAVTLERLIGPEGVWSVTAVESPELSLADYHGAEVVPGETSFELPTSLPDGTLVSAGFATWTGSCQARGETEVEVIDGLVRFQLQDGLTGCDGYLYLMHPPTGEGQVPVGQIMFIHGEPKPALGYHVQAMAAVPVHFVPVSGAPPGGIEPLPTVASVTCSDAGTQVSIPVVQPQPDGVHILVDNSTGEILGMQIEDFGGDNAPPGTSEIVWPIPPGVHGLACLDPLATAPPTYQPFEVQDPAGIWVSTDLIGCASAAGMGAGSASPSSDITGVQGTPVDVVTSTISGLLPTDLIEAAGYPSATDEASVRVVRDGEVVAVYHMFSDGQGGWTIDSAQACAGTDLASLGSATYPQGAFQRCPDPPFPEAPSNWEERASAVALRFVDAYVADDTDVLAQLTDASVPADAVWPITVAPGKTPTVIGTNAAGGDLVRFGCGPDVDAYTVAITIDDGTDSASADFTLYLVLRADGWKVWGSY